MITPHRVTPTFTTIQRFRDWEAHVTGDPKRWEAGRTEAEAIGKLMITLADRGGLVTQTEAASDVQAAPVLIDRFDVIEQWGTVLALHFPARTYPNGVPLHVLLTELQCPAFVDRWPASAKTAFVDGFGDLGDPGKDVQVTWSRMLRATDECTTEGAYSAVCALRNRAMHAAIAVLKG